MRVETVYKMRTHMKRISAAALALFCATSFGATLNPVQLLNPAGSTSGQAILSTGATTPPAWTTITPAIIGGLQASNNLSDVASATAALINLGGLSTTAAASTYATITNLNLKAPLASPTFSGTVTIPAGAAISGYAPLASPTFTGTVNAAALTASGALTPSQTAGIVGTTTNNNANAGSLGEFPTPTNLTAVPLTAGANANCASVALTAGDWDVTGVIVYKSAASTVTTGMYASTSTTSVTFGAEGTLANYIWPSGAALTAGVTVRIVAPVNRISLASSGTAYLVGQSLFTTSTATCDGYIRARRVR